MANGYRDFDSRQDFGSYGFQIYVFKVEINCCKDCPVKLRKKLQDLDGIESVEVDERRNLATVKGILDSRKIIKKIKEWGKIAELVHERKETNARGYMVELIDEEEEKREKDLFNDSFRHKDSSFHHTDSSDRHNNSSFRRKNSSFRHTDSSDHRNNSSFCSRDKNRGSTHAPEKYDHSERNAYSAKEVPDHICRDKYCTIHRRDNSMPNMNYGASFPPLFRGGLNYNYPPMNSYVPPPPMYGPPPPPYYGQYHDPGMVPPVAGYGYGGYEKFSNGCTIM